MTRTNKTSTQGKFITTTGSCDAVNVPVCLTELYHIAMDKEDHTLAFRVLQTMAKDTDKPIAPLETLSDDELLQLLDAWVPHVELSP
jgi:hypothetical protein